MGETPERCEHEPQEGTVYTTAGLPAEKARAGDTLDAVCAGCGQPVRAASAAGPWRPKYPQPGGDDLAADFRARHPEVTIGADGRTASWHDADGAVHEVSYGSAAGMLGFLAARFDGQE